MVTFESWKISWQRAYETTLTPSQQKTRLKELQTWDQPNWPRDQDPLNKWIERDAKIAALESLLNFSPAQ